MFDLILSLIFLCGVKDNACGIEQVTDHHFVVTACDVPEGNANSRALYEDGGVIKILHLRDKQDKLDIVYKYCSGG